MADDGEATVVLPSVSIFPSELREFVIPGAALLVALAMQEGHFSAGGVPRPVHAALELVRLHLGQVFPSENGTAVSLVVALVGLLWVYVLGHGLASASSLLLDRILIAKSYGYPYSYLGQSMGLEEPVDCPHTPTPAGPTYYSGFLFWLNFPIVAGLIACSFPASGIARLIAQTAICGSALVIVSTVVAKLSRPSDKLKTSWRRLVSTFTGRTGAESGKVSLPRTFVLLGLLVAAMSGAFQYLHPSLHVSVLTPCLLNGWIVFSITLGLLALLAAVRRSEGFAGDYGAEVRRIVLDKVFPMPYQMFGSTLRHLLATNESFPPSMRILWARRLESFGVTLKSGGTEIFWVANLWLLQRGGPLARKISDWQIQYGFCRNLAASMWLAYLYGAWLIAVARFASSPPMPSALLVDEARTALTLFALANVMLYRYYYIFFKYFSKKLFEAFIWFGPDPSTPVAVLTGPTSR